MKGVIRTSRGEKTDGVPCKGKRILAVTHAGLMRAMLVRLGLEEAETVFGKKIPFGGIVMLEKTPEGYICRTKLEPR